MLICEGLGEVFVQEYFVDVFPCCFWLCGVETVVYGFVNEFVGCVLVLFICFNGVGFVFRVICGFYDVNDVV